MSARKQGIVKFFNAHKGFGFITPNDGTADVFVHITALKNSGVGALSDGDVVQFETEPSQRQPSKGPVAVNIAVVG